MAVFDNDCIIFCNFASDGKSELIVVKYGYSLYVFRISKLIPEYDDVRGRSFHCRRYPTLDVLVLWHGDRHGFAGNRQ